MNGIPGNFVDKKTGETLKPVYKFQDALGVWHQKDLAHCTWSELHDFCVALWGAWMEEKTVKRNLSVLDILKILLMTVGATTIIFSVVILIAMFVQ